MDEAKEYAARIREAAKTAGRWETFCTLLPLDKLEPVPEKGGPAKTVSEADRAAMEAAAERAAMLAAWHLDGTDEAEDGEAEDGEAEDGEAEDGEAEDGEAAEAPARYEGVSR